MLQLLPGLSPQQPNSFARVVYTGSLHLLTSHRLFNPQQIWFLFLLHSTEVIFCKVTAIVLFVMLTGHFSGLPLVDLSEAPYAVDLSLLSETVFSCLLCFSLLVSLVRAVSACCWVLGACSSPLHMPLHHLTYW